MDPNPEKLLQEKKQNPDELKARFPILKPVDNKDPRFITLCDLLIEMANLKYAPARQNEMMYKIIKIDNLMCLLFPEMKVESAVELLAKYQNAIEVSKLGIPEQRALFLLSRNIPCDFSHVLSSAEIKLHLETFSLLCQGICNPAELAGRKSDYTRVTKTPRIKQILSDKEDPKKERTGTLLCQMGYYLFKSKRYDHCWQS